MDDPKARTDVLRVRPTEFTAAKPAKLSPGWKNPVRLGSKHDLSFAKFPDRFTASSPADSEVYSDQGGLLPAPTWCSRMPAGSDHDAGETSTHQ